MERGTGRGGRDERLGPAINECVAQRIDVWADLDEVYLARRAPMYARRIVKNP